MKINSSVNLVFIGVMFASAALIFVLQPMFARMTTPLLGGSPAVWNTSMVFFQAALLLGYAYANRLAVLPDLRMQLGTHAAVLAVAAVALVLAGQGVKVGVAPAMGPPDSASPIAWLLPTLALSIGLPYAALSATAPLLQAWYAKAAGDNDPYHLYAASNLGSLLGLAAYPVALEPLLGLGAQTALWAYGFLVVAIGVAVAGAITLRASPGGAASERPERRPAPASWRDRLFWMGAAAVPSSLLLAVTTHISTDVASAPFLWVVPLALYLLTFVIAFARGSEVWRSGVALLQPVALAGLLLAFSDADFWIVLPASLAAFFLSGLVCHMALAARRPPVAQLTEFYLWVSIGGGLGGAATALVAPVVFNDVYEYPLALAAVALFLPRKADEPLPTLTTAFLALAVIALAAGRTFQDGWMVTQEEYLQGAGIWALGLLAVAATAEDRIATYASLFLSAACAAAGVALLLQGTASDRNALVYAPTLFAVSALIFMARQRALMREVTVILGLALLAALAFVVLNKLGILKLPGASLSAGFGEGPLFLVLGVLAVAIFANRGKPFVAAGLVLAAFVGVYLDHADRNVVFQGRSFFGVTRVIEYRDVFKDGPLRVMMHGTTIHGAQFVEGARVTDPLTYYHPDTALGSATLSAIGRFETARIGLIGLGTGSTACLARPTDQLTIFEIDPMVVDFSFNRGLDGVFTFAPRCAPDARIVLGDARLGVQTLPENSLDVLVVDAFSSDAVPAHLLTREAIELYLSKLSPEGVAILHLSNRNLDLVSEASRVARAGDWGSLGASLEGGANAPDSYTSFATSVLVIGRTQSVVESLNLGPDWTPAPILQGRAWSDDYINLVRPLLAGG